MILLEKTSVMNLENAVRGARNPMNSWEKSDSFRCTECSYPFCEHKHECWDDYVIGPNDLDLCMRLRKAGPDHRKFMRQIFVSVDITAPLYWWKEYDTYKVGTTANSCSTMHTIHKRRLTIEDFSIEHLSPYAFVILSEYIWDINGLIRRYTETKDKQDWYSIIQMLPSSFNQMRTCTLTYENLVNIYYARRYHKLDEWHDFCEWIEKLPYSGLITGGNNETD